MKININTVSSGWILQKISERTSNALNRIQGVECNVKHNVDPNSDVNLYFYIQNIRFLNTSNTQNKNSIFEKNIRVTFLLYHLCLPLVFILIFGFILIDDLFIFFK